MQTELTFNPSPNSGKAIDGITFATQAQLMMQSLASGRYGTDRPGDAEPNSFYLRGPRVASGKTLIDWIWWDGSMEHNCWSYNLTDGQLTASNGLLGRSIAFADTDSLDALTIGEAYGYTSRTHPSNPFPGEICMIWVKQISASTCQQIAYSVGTGMVAQRYYNGSWLAWKRIAVPCLFDVYVLAAGEAATRMYNVSSASLVSTGVYNINLISPISANSSLPFVTVLSSSPRIATASKSDTDGYVWTVRITDQNGNPTNNSFRAQA